MTPVLTLVSSKPQRPLQLSYLEDLIQQMGFEVVRIKWLSRDKAADLYLAKTFSASVRAQLTSLLAEKEMDHFLTEDGGTRKKQLLVADMDNTMVIGETLDELADRSGIKDEVAEITHQAMLGKLDFPTALIERVKMLKGLGEEALVDTLRTITTMPGAKRLVATMKGTGATCVLVSGGFTCFTSPIARELGFDHDYGNIFQVENGRLSGKVSGKIIDHKSKREYLELYRKKLNLERSDILAVGDGANDIDMIDGAGLGVGFHPKPLLQEKAYNNILHGDLTALLYAQGYSESQIRES